MERTLSFLRQVAAMVEGKVALCALFWLTHPQLVSAHSDILSFPFSPSSATDRYREEGETYRGNTFSCVRERGEESEEKQRRERDCNLCCFLRLPPPPPSSTTMTLIRGLRRAHPPRIFNRRASSSGATGGRLPANTPPFFAEFPHGRLQDFRTRVRELRHLSRVALSRSIATLLRPQNVAGLAVTTLFAAAVGTAEGWQRAAAAAALLQAEIALAQDAEQMAQHRAREQQARLTAFIQGQKVEEGAGGGPFMYIAAAIGRVLVAVEKLKLGVQQWDDEKGEMEVGGLDETDNFGLEAHGDLHTGSGGDAAGEEKTLEQAALNALGEELGRFAAVYGMEQIPAALAMLTADPLQVS